MGKKYIIELCDKPMKNENGEDIWRVKGFNTLVFDQNGLDKLEEYVEPVGHKFEVGDVCYLPGEYENNKFIVTRITGYTVEYMCSNGSLWSRFKKPFEEKAIFMYHSDSFSNFMKGDFT